MLGGLGLSGFAASTASRLPYLQNITQATHNLCGRVRDVVAMHVNGRRAPRVALVRLRSEHSRHMVLHTAACSTLALPPEVAAHSAKLVSLPSPLSNSPAWCAPSTPTPASRPWPATPSTAARGPPSHWAPGWGWGTASPARWVPVCEGRVWGNGLGPCTLVARAPPWGPWVHEACIGLEDGESSTVRLCCRG